MKKEGGGSPSAGSASIMPIPASIVATSSGVVASALSSLSSLCRTEVGARCWVLVCCGWARALEHGGCVVCGDVVCVGCVDK